MTRAPASDHFDAVVDLFPLGQMPQFAYGLVKLTYRAVGGQLVPLPPDPLEHDIRDRSGPPSLPTGSDFWTGKAATDVVVLGDAHAPAGRPAHEWRVAVAVGRLSKRITVYGNRTVVWRDGVPRITAPEPFQTMAITRENAYGGMDGRVPWPEPVPPPEAMSQIFDHPGMYPRNPFGKGYLVDPAPAPEPVPLPNLDNPADPLTPERLVTGDPTQWWRQPLPWCLDWHHAMMFPRYVFFGCDAWFPGPQDTSLPEVREGYLAPGYRDLFLDKDKGAGTMQKLPLIAYQEASLGLAVPNLEPNTPLSVQGMHPEGKAIELALPPPPRMRLTLEGSSADVRPQLTNVVIHPAEEKVTLTYFGRWDELPRPFIAGIHGHIPLSLTVDRHPPIVYETPPTVRDQLAAAQAPKPT